MGTGFRRLVRLAPVVGIAAALMVATAVVAAAGDAASIQPQSGKLVAKGVEVDVTVTFTCPAGDKVGNQFGMPGGADVYLQEAISRTAQASGSGFTSGQICTGQPQNAIVQVLANVPGPPFRKGPAVAGASLQACDANFNCIYVSSAPVAIHIR